MNLTAEQLLSLAVLRVQEGQVLVHQAGTAYGITPQAIFYRRGGIALKPKGGLHTFRKLVKAGLIEPAPVQNGYSGQTEYALTSAANARFESDAEWRIAETVLREAALNSAGVKP